MAAEGECGTLSPGSIGVTQSDSETQRGTVREFRRNRPECSPVGCRCRGHAGCDDCGLDRGQAGGAEGVVEWAIPAAAGCDRGAVSGARRRAEQATDAFQENYRIRAGGESVNSGLKRRTGMGRVRTRGSPRVRMAVMFRRAGRNMFRAPAAFRRRGIRDFAAFAGAFCRILSGLGRRQAPAFPSIHWPESDKLPFRGHSPRDGRRRSLPGTGGTYVSILGAKRRVLPQAGPF